MKLEFGQFVRTKYGIGKITGFRVGEYLYTDAYEMKIPYSEIIGKPSFNPIDLIEVGDILDCEFGGIISKSEVIKEDNELGIGWDDDGDFINLESLYINSILTREQFSAMEYKID